jgi:hypothetical protein
LYAVPGWRWIGQARARKKAAGRRETDLPPSSTDAMRVFVTALLPENRSASLP